jgi:hypothetical protein
MHVVFCCPTCERPARATPSAGGELSCTHCHWSRPVGKEERLEEGPRRCLVCGCDDLWRQKDFPQNVGLAIVALGAILSSLFWWKHMPLTSLGILLAFALADMVLFMVMKDVLVCYRCKARYLDVPPDASVGAYSLDTAERYRQEAARIDQSQTKKLGHPPAV